MAESDTEIVPCSIVVLCGLPGSGKSCFSRHLSSWLLESGKFLPVIINYDKLMPPDLESNLIEEHQKEEKSPWKVYREDIVQCVQSLLQKLVKHSPSFFTKTKNELLFDKFKELIQQQIIQEMYDVKRDVCELSPIEQEIQELLLDENCTSTSTPVLYGENSWMNLKDNITVIIIDDNMYYRSMRFDYYQLARQFTVGFCEVYVDCLLETALDRNSKRTEDYVNPQVIENMASGFQRPDKTCHSWEKYSLSFHSTALTESLRKSVLQLVESALSDPVQPLVEIDSELIAASREICSVNQIHQTDLILRQLISDKMIQAKHQGTDKAGMKDLSSILGNIKTRILESVKKGGITLPVSDNIIVNSSKDKTSELYQHIKNIFDEKIS